MMHPTHEIEPLRFTRLGQLADASDAAVDWVVEGMVPRAGVTMLVARPGAGKSMVACHIGACVAAGLPVFGHHPVSAGAVVYLDLDMHRPGLMRMRGYAAFRGVGLSDTAIDAAPFLPVCDRPTLDLTDPLVLEDALAALATVSRLALVVLDTFSDAHTGKEQSSDEMVIAMRAITAVAVRRNCGVLVLHLARKGGAGTDLYDMRGSTALPAKSDAVFFLRREGDDTHDIVLSQGKARLTAEAPAVTLTLNITDGERAGDLVRYSYGRSESLPEPAKRGRPPTEVDCERILDDLVTNRPGISRGERANALTSAGVSRATAYRKVQEYEEQNPPAELLLPLDDLIYADDTSDEAFP